MPAEKILRVEIPPRLKGGRLDKALAELCPQHSRSTLQKWLAEGRVRCGGATAGRRFTVQGGEAVVIRMPPARPLEWRAQAMELSIVHADGDLLVVDKPPGLVVHPGAGNADRTLVNGLLHFDPALAALPRAGIVHRLDKDTSGLLAVARTEAARLHLGRQLKRRSAKRAYDVLVSGAVIAGGEVNAPIGRHPTERLRMAVRERGRPALTRYRVAARYRAHTLLRAELATGRTHQIRVHLAHAGFPVFGDPVYGRRKSMPPGATEKLRGQLRAFRRQALHACELALVHPTTGEAMQWRAQPPADLAGLLAALADDARGG